MSLFRKTPRPEVPGVGSTNLQIWRITTAARVFVLATAAGQVVVTGPAAEALWTWVALAIIAAACCVAELPLTATRALFVPVTESAAAVSVLTLSLGPEPLAVYLVLPTLVAGVRLGVRAVWVTSATTTAALFLTHAFAMGSHDGLRAVSLTPWVVVGLGAGLLAASLTRTVRQLASSRAPYASAQQLLARWDGLVADGKLNLDLSLLCRELRVVACSEVGAGRSAVWVRDGLGEPSLLAADSAAGSRAKAVVAHCLDTGVAWSGQGTVTLPLRSGETTFGAVSLEVDHRPAPAVLASAQTRIDEHAFRLQTAMILDGVRCRATSEERRRLARELHDGVAQRLATVAHLSDEIAAETPDEGVVALADHLHDEVVKIVEELRSSVLDLHEDESAGLSAALATHVRGLSRHSPLRVHLSLDERGERLPARTEAEVVRIAREAIGNVTKHARAVNLWVTLATDGYELRLTVADDGVGCARPRTGHFGLHTMRERAELVGAELGITERQDGGTVVALLLRPTPTTKECRDDDHRLARR